MAVVCTIPSPTAKSAGGHRKRIRTSVANAQRMARMRWISEPTSFKTEIPDFAGAFLAAATTSKSVESFSAIDKIVTVRIIAEVWGRRSSGVNVLGHDS